jgi:flavorubredoxin
MPITNNETRTTVDEVADGVYRISTPAPIPGGPGFSFNQYLIDDDEPLLFHTGPRKLFPFVKQAVESVMPAERLRHISFSHFEADECGSLNEWLAAAPNAAPLCGAIAAMVSIGDIADRPPRALGDGETAEIGRRKIRWIDAPHMPHAWECGFLFDELTDTLFCGDLFTQPGETHPPLTEGDILGPSEEFRKALDYFSHTKNAAALIDKIAATNPATLACMHGSAWRGDGAALLRELGKELAADN